MRHAIILINRFLSLGISPNSSKLFVDCVTPRLGEASRRQYGSHLSEMLARTVPVRVTTLRAIALVW